MVLMVTVRAIHDGKTTIFLDKFEKDPVLDIF